jgi:hypothetical protein
MFKNQSLPLKPKHCHGPGFVCHTTSLHGYSKCTLASYTSGQLRIARQKRSSTEQHIIQGRLLSALEGAHLPHNPFFSVLGSAITQAYYAVSQLLLKWLFFKNPKPGASNGDLKDGTVRPNGGTGAPASLCQGHMKTSETPPPVQRTGATPLNDRIKSCLQLCPCLDDARACPLCCHSAYVY